MDAAAADPSQLFSKRFVRRLVLPLTLAALAYAGLLFYGDASLIGAALGSLSLAALLAGVGLSLASFGLRGVRWLWYLRFLGIRVPLGISLLVFVTGLGMSITPGKAGELLKSLLLKEKLDIPVANTVPIVIAERLTDLFAMVALAAGGLGWLWSPWAGVAALLGCLAIFFLLGKSQRLVWSVASAAIRLFRLDRYHDKLFTAQRVLWQLWEPRAYGTPMLLSLSAWTLQAIIIVVFTMGWPAGAVSLPAAIVAYSAPLLAGTLLLLPGGVGLTEASMTGVLEALCGMTRAEAAALTILVRLATFWLAVVLGFSTLAAWRPWDASRRAPASTP